jgi:hypothetical protein
MRALYLDRRWSSGTSYHTTLADIPAYALKPTHQVLPLLEYADALAMLLFRRHAQLIALDTLPAFGDAGRRPASRPRSPTVPLATAPLPHWRPPTKIVAWWEDDIGWWLITSEARVETVPLTMWWTELLGDGTMDNREERPESGAVAETNNRKRLPIWAKACESLLQVVETLRVSSFLLYC